MAKLRSHKCPSCSAPLSVPPNATDVQCPYCSNSIHIERGRAPRQEIAGPSTVLYLDAGIRAARWVVISTVSGVALVSVITGFLVIGADKPGPRHVVADKTLTTVPAVCPPNGVVRLANLEHSGTGVLVDAGANCKVSIHKSRLSGEVIVRGASNVQVELVDSVLVAERSAIELGSNGKLRIRGASRIEGDEAIVARSNVEIDAEGIEVKGKRAALVLGSNATLTLAKSQVSAERTAVSLGSNATVTLRESSLTAQTALSADSVLNLRAEGSTLAGDTDAVRAGGNAQITISRASTLSAKGTAMTAGSSAAFELTDARVTGGRRGLQGGSNSRLVLGAGAVISGEEVGASFGSNSKVTLSGGSIESAATGLEMERNATLEGRGGAVRGKNFAYDIQGLTRPASLEDTNIEGRIRPAAHSKR